MKADTICCFRLSKPTKKRSILESLHAQITRARLCVRWVYFERNNITFKNMLTPLFEEPCI